MKTLKENIAEYDENKKKVVPSEILSVMAQATQDLENSGIVDKSLKTGAHAPKFTLTNHKGEIRSLPGLLEESVGVLSFYRGGWCPYCNMELNALQKVLPQIEANGAQLIAISPELPDNSLSTREKNELSFEILYDQGNKVAEEFGLVFILPEVLRPIYEKFGLDIPAYNGDDTFKLPMPATYIIGQDGQILYHFVDPDYTKRLEPADIVQELTELQR